MYIWADDNKPKPNDKKRPKLAADPVFIVLLALHIGAVVSWMGGAILFTSIVMPSLAKMSPPSRTEFIQSALPRYIRFSAGSAILAVVAGIALFGYITQVNTTNQPSAQGFPIVTSGAIVGLVVLIIALGIMVPSGRKFVQLTKQPPGQDAMPKIASLQKRMGTASRVGVALLGIALILMVIGASI